MDHRDFYCPYIPLSEPTAKGTGLAKTVGKEDPVELNSNQFMSNDTKDIVVSGKINF